MIYYYNWIKQGRPTLLEFEAETRKEALRYVEKITGENIYLIDRTLLARKDAVSKFTV